MLNCQLLYRRLLLSFFCIAPIIIHGQTIGGYTGEKVYLSESGNFRLLDFDSTRLFVLRDDSGRVYYLEGYSRDSLKKLFSIKIPLPSRDSVHFNLKTFFIHNDYYQIFYSYFHQTSKQERLDMVSFSNTGEKIGEIKTISYTEVKKGMKVPGFSVFNSPESNEFFSYGSKYIKGRISISVDHFDYSGNKLRTENFEQLTDPNDIIYSTIDLSGEIMFVTKDYYSAFTPDWKIKIYSPSNGKHFTLVLQKTIGRHLFLSEKFYSFKDSSGDLTFITPYSEGPTSEYDKGMFLVKINLKDHSILREEFIPYNINADEEDMDDFSLPFSIITNVFFMPGGKLNILFESRLETSGMNITYEIGNILSVEVDSNYKVSGICRIDKKQKVEDNNYVYTGFNVLHKGAKCFFIYNELPQNLTLNDGISAKKIKNSKVKETVISLVVTENSKISERKALIEKNDSSYIDALLPDKTLYSDRFEMFSIRRINSENYLTKFYIKGE